MSFFFFFAEMALFCLSWVLLEDGPLKGCVCVCVCVCVQDLQLLSRSGQQHELREAPRHAT